MIDKKYCPECQQQNDINALECSKCGFQFVIVEKKDDMVSTNTKVFVDRVPLWVWSFISFLCPIAGLVFYIIWKQKWPERSRVAGKMALTMSIVYIVILIIVISLLIGLKTGDVV